MIVPSGRLLFWVALLALPAVLLASTLPATAPVAYGLVALLAMAVVLDLAFCSGRFQGLSIEATGLTRLSSERPGHIDLTLRNRARWGRRIRLGLPFPLEIKSEHEILEVRVAADHETFHLRWPVCATRRGRYWIDACYAELDSPIGFWSIRRRFALSAEVRVYPNLLRERRALAGLFLSHGGPGIHTRRVVGKGREFEKLREYIPGDDTTDIHWKATAKRGRPITKVYQVERTQEVCVVLDASRLSGRELAWLDDSASQPEGQTILDRYIVASLILLLAAERQGDRFGLTTFRDRVLHFIPPGGGPRHYDACREALYTLQPQRVTPDFAELFTFLRTRLRRRTLLVFLTHLDDPSLSEAFQSHIDLLARHHLIQVCMLTPEGVQPVFSEPAQSLDDLYTHLGGHLLWRDMERLKVALHRHGVRFDRLQSEGLASDVVTQYLDIKRRQLL